MTTTYNALVIKANNLAKIKVKKKTVFGGNNPEYFIIA
jgi:hypothetical protein